MKIFRSLIAAAVLTGLTAAAHAVSFSGLFIFGDSLSDSGNNTAVIGSNPGQVIDSNSYIPTQTYASGQYSNGNVWAVPFATALGLGPFAAPALGGGGNFAFGGARTSTEGSVGGFPPSLISQAGLFLSLAGGVAPSDALYVVAGGGNDARDTLQAAAADLGNAGAIIGAAATTYALSTEGIVHALQGAGAQHIVVWNIPNLGLAPAVTAAGGAALGSAVSAVMNSALSSVMADEAGVTVFDNFSLLSVVAANPGVFGLTNVTDACGNVAAGCDPLSSLFWDGIHPTAAGHNLLAAAMLSTVNAVPEPASYALLAAGLLVVGLRARRRA